MKVAVGSDHAGFKLKGYVLKYLREKKITFEDFGCYTSESVDYPHIAYKVAKAVDKGEFDRGILVCGSGVGMAVTANKVHGIRAVQAYDVYTAKQSREHVDTNVLTLAGRRIDKGLALRIIGTWLKVKFLGGRHQRRVEMVMRIHKVEQQHRKGIKGEEWR